MHRFLAKRLAQSFFVVLAVTLLVAYAVRLSGDPAIMLSQGAGRVTEDDLRNIRTALGLDQPFIIQYLQFIRGLLTGEMGRSFWGGAAVGALIANALPLTLLLAGSSLILSLALAVPLGVHAAVHRGQSSDRVIRVVCLLGLSFPNFWLAMMMVLVLSITLGWLPPSGAAEPANIVMPAITMAVILTANNLRLVRSSMLETLAAQYIMVARAKGLSETVVLYTHALRNCIIPLLTFVGLQFGSLIGGIVVVEQVFDWPGMGSLAFEAVVRRDYPVLQGVIAVLAIVIVMVNLAIDILYGFLDPRLRND